MGNNKIFSWKIIDDLTVQKEIDQSVIKYNQTGIPIQLRKYWGVEHLERGLRKEIVLIYNSRQYLSYIQMENSKRMRTKLYWPSELTRQIVERKFVKWIKFQNVRDVWQVEFINDENSDEEIKEGNFEFETFGKEGKRIVYYTSRYERSGKLRKEAIQHHGLKCSCCEINFGEKYGEWGEGFIEIHHVKPLSSLDKEEVVYAKTDLVPVCSNCHRMIHRKKGEILSIDELSNIILQAERKK